MRPIPIFLILFLLYSCKPPQQSCAKIPIEEQTLSEASFLITIEALNLSEDLSILSTKNDEILFFIFPYDSLELQEPVYKKYLVFDTLIKSRVLEEPEVKKIPGKALFFLLELDDETSTGKIDSTLRIHHQEIIKLFYQHDAVQLERYLGDNDLLGVKVLENFNLLKSFNFEFTGFFRADKYHYRMSILLNKK